MKRPKNYNKIRKSLKYSILDGAFHSAMVGFGESFFAAFATFLNATNFQLGLLGALPQALGSFVQLFANKLLKVFKSRKLLVCLGAFLQALTFIPIALVFFFGTLKVYHLIFFVSLFWIFGSIISPAWNSWMGDLVSQKHRGLYFGKRNKIAGLVTLIALFTSGFILQQFYINEFYKNLGFMLIFTIAFFSRIISVVYLSMKYEPGFHVTKKSEFSFFQFLSKARHTNQGIFVFFLCFMNFSVFIASPFFAGYMFYGLRFDYMTYAVIISISLLVRLLFMPVWGKACDRFGNRRVIALTGFLLPFVPLLWMLSPNIGYLALVQVFSGFVWAGFDISTFNFIFDTTSHGNRAAHVAYLNVMNGMFIILGSFAGALLIKYNHFSWSIYFTAFAVSALARLISAVVFIPKLKEVRIVKPISYQNLLFNVAKPTMGIVHGVITFIPAETRKINVLLSNKGIKEEMIRKK